MTKSRSEVCKDYYHSLKGQAQRQQYYPTLRDKSKRCRRKQREVAVLKLGGKCANPACQWLNDDGSRGCMDIRCLQIDHVLGGGNQERKQGLAGYKLYKDVVADTTGKYQLLCANCNWIKKTTNHENWFD